MGPWTPVLALLAIAIFLSYILPVFFRFVTRVVRGLLFGMVALVALTVASNMTSLRILGDASAAVTAVVNGVVVVFSSFF